MDSPAKDVVLFESEDENDAEMQRYLTFQLEGESYGIDIVRIKEILEYPTVTRVPMTPRYIAGVINLRGNVVPVIEVATRLGKQAGTPTRRTCVLIVDVSVDNTEMEIGIVVDMVNEVVALPEESHEAAPSFGVDIRHDFIRHMGRLDRKFIILLNIDNVLDIEELARFGQHLSPDSEREKLAH